MKIKLKPSMAGNSARLIPPDMPQACPQCGKAFSLFANYSTRTARVGRLLHRGALIGGLAGFLIVMAWHFLLPPAGADRSLGFGMAVGLVAPVFFLEGLAIFWPKVRTLSCHACAWESDFLQEIYSDMIAAELGVRRCGGRRLRFGIWTGFRRG